MKSNTIIGTASLTLALAVMIGAFGAHGLKEVLLENNTLSTFKTGVEYHFYHGFALLIYGICCQQVQVNKNYLVPILFITGIILFSGSLYILSVSGIRYLGAITPFGGLCFIAAWIVMAIEFFKK